MSDNDPIDMTDRLDSSHSQSRPCDAQRTERLIEPPAEEDPCSLCYTNRVVYINKPCNHMAGCYECVCDLVVKWYTSDPASHKCMICKQPVHGLFHRDAQALVTPAEMQACFPKEMKYEQEQRDIEHKQEVEQYEAWARAIQDQTYLEDAEEYDDGIHNGELHLAFVPRMNRIPWHGMMPMGLGPLGRMVPVGMANPFRVRRIVRPASQASGQSGGQAGNQPDQAMPDLEGVEEGGQASEEQEGQEGGQDGHGNARQGGQQTRQARQMFDFVRSVPIEDGSGRVHHVQQTDEEWRQTMTYMDRMLNVFQQLNGFATSLNSRANATGVSGASGGNGSGSGSGLNSRDIPRVLVRPPSVRLSRLPNRMASSRSSGSASRALVMPDDLTQDENVDPFAEPSSHDDHKQQHPSTPIVTSVESSQAIPQAPSLRPRAESNAVLSPMSLQTDSPFTNSSSSVSRSILANQSNSSQTIPPPAVTMLQQLLAGQVGRDEKDLDVNDRQYLVESTLEEIDARMDYEPSEQGEDDDDEDEEDADRATPIPVHTMTTRTRAQRMQVNPEDAGEVSASEARPLTRAARRALEQERNELPNSSHGYQTRTRQSGRRRTYAQLRDEDESDENSEQDDDEDDEESLDCVE